jgi:tRNA U34 2-thiouridine synthase MnmA/TrmU
MNEIINTSSASEPVKAVGMISGGLDSTLAAKIMKDLGVDVYGVYFAMPWGCCDKTKAIEAALKLKIKFIVLQLDERYLEMIQKPKYGYGSALNPCVDCRIHMFSRAAQYMDQIGAKFVFTGEVMGQRQMSQLKKSLKWVEEGSGLKGRLLRPLCAQLLEPTIPEITGLVDRSKLLNITGRSRHVQLKIAKDNNITEFTAIGGGCLLTDPNFARRMKDTLDHGYKNFRETVALKWGRHFRINEKFKIVVGRDEEESISLTRYAHPTDHVMHLPSNDGPVALIKGETPDENIFSLAAGLIQRFSKYRDQPPIEVNYWMSQNRNDIKMATAKPVSELEIEAFKI